MYFAQRVVGRGNIMNETTVEEATRVLRKAYYDDVRGVADALLECIESGELQDAKDADTWLHETVDGHARVIYTGQAMDCLRYSDHDSAYFDDFGTDGIIEDGSINWSGLAYAAFMADIREHLDDLDALFAERANAEAETDE